MRDARRIDRLGRLALVTIVLVFSALVSRNVVRPLLIARYDLGAYRNAIQILRLAEGDLSRIDTEIQQATEEIAAGEALLPPTLNLDEFLLRAENAARAAGVRIEGVTPREVIEHRNSRELGIDLRVTGSCTALYAFLVEVEQGRQLSRVKELRMVSEPTDARCAMELRLALYFSPREAA